MFDHNSVWGIEEGTTQVCDVFSPFLKGISRFCLLTINSCVHQNTYDVALPDRQSSPQESENAERDPQFFFAFVLFEPNPISL
jgi:hypothetical protein